MTKVLQYAREKNILEKPVIINALDEFSTFETQVHRLENIHGGTDGYKDRKYYHLIVSMSPEDTADLLNRKNGISTFSACVQDLIKETIEEQTFGKPGEKNKFRLLGEMSIHLDKGMDSKKDNPKLHAHIIFSSLDINTGRKFHLKDTDRWKMKQKTNELAQRYGFRVVGFENAHTKQHHKPQFDSSKTKRGSWIADLREVAEKALLSSSSLLEFYTNLSKAGVQITDKTKGARTRNDFLYTYTTKEGEQKKINGSKLSPNLSKGAVVKFFNSIEGRSNFKKTEQYSHKDIPLYYSGRIDLRNRVGRAADKATSLSSFVANLRADGVEIIERKIRGTSEKDERYSITGKDGRQYKYLAKTLNEKFSLKAMAGELNDHSFKSEISVPSSADEMKSCITEVAQNSSSIKDFCTQLQEKHDIYVYQDSINGTEVFNYRCTNCDDLEMSIVGCALQDSDIPTQDDLFSLTLEPSEKEMEENDELIITASISPSQPSSQHQESFVDVITQIIMAGENNSFKPNASSFNMDPCTSCPYADGKGDACESCMKPGASRKKIKEGRSR